MVRLPNQVLLRTGLRPAAGHQHDERMDGRGFTVT